MVQIPDTPSRTVPNTKIYLFYKCTSLLMVQIPNKLVIVVFIGVYVLSFIVHFLYFVYSLYLHLSILNLNLFISLRSCTHAILCFHTYTHTHTLYTHLSPSHLYTHTIYLSHNLIDYPWQWSQEGDVSEQQGFGPF